MSDLSALKAAIEATRADPRLGRSEQLRRLFEYLAESSLTERSPKETEVAIEVFGRRPDFDPARDAVARVYVHKLRRRLEEIGDVAGGGLTIPRGEYRLALRTEAPAVEVEETGLLSRRRVLVAAAAAVAATAGLAGWIGGAEIGPRPAPQAAASRTTVWKALAANGRPTIVAVGDYYIFAEMKPDGARLVREYSVNSADEFDRFVRDNPQRAEGYTDLGLSYLPVGVGSVLMNVSQTLIGAKDVRVLPVSGLTPAMLRDSNIVYVGYLSGLGMLRDATFAGSRYTIGETYDAIIDEETHERFESGGGAPRPGGAVYSEYGYLSTFAGPEGNRFVIIAGTRDAALMQMGQTAISLPALENLAKVGGRDAAGEALYSIDGMNQGNAGGRLVRSAPLNQAAIWSDAAGEARTFPDG